MNAGGPKVVGMPGPGGSMGECALCGENFLLEIITASRVKSITVDGCNATLYAHDKCIKQFRGKDFTELPEKSSLRKAFEKGRTKA